MNTETMTVHEALCELKTLNKRIATAIQRCRPVACKEHSANNVGGMTVEKFNEAAQSAHQSAMDLIRRRAAIKSAINRYNATATINIGDKTYTVAEAIWLMEHGMESENELLNRYTSFMVQSIADVEDANGEALNRRAERAADSFVNGKEKVNSDEYHKCIEDYKRAHTLEMVDPLDIRKVVADMEERIAQFESRVDSALQISNATTTIEISY